MMPEIRLASGVLFNVVEPDPRLMTPEVIAAGLSKMCRFGGHTKRFYSVAEHCVRGSYVCEDPLAFLLHDASEAFVVDVPTPIKRLLVGYAEIEDRIHRQIEVRYGVSIIENEAVHRTDKLMLATEQQDLVVNASWDMQVEPLKGLDLASCSGRPETWEKRWLERFYELRSPPIQTIAEVL